MDNLNKTISFILGLVVVLVFFAVITGRINLKGKLPTLGKTPTPTPTQTQLYDNNNQNNKNINSEMGTYKSTTAKTPTSIPQTGSPTLLIPIMVSALGSGIMLRRIKK